MTISKFSIKDIKPSSLRFTVNLNQKKDILILLPRVNLEFKDSDLRP